jgi:hypothetical protein
MLVTALPSHAGDGAVGATWLRHDVYAESCGRRCNRVMLAMELLGQFGHDVMYMPSHAEDGVAES